MRRVFDWCCKMGRARRNSCPAGQSSARWWRNLKLGALGLVLVLLAGWVWLACTPPPALLDGLSYSRVVLDRHNGLLRLGLSADDKYRVRVRLGDIPPEAVQALLVYEDRYFYRHGGVNPVSLLRAALQTCFGGRRVGGSTITMQVVRLRNQLPTTTVSGKMRQILQAVQLEYHYSKQAILEAYFTLAPYGGNVEGLGAAAWVYFHKDPRRLTLAECLALTVVPQNPVKRDPLRGPDFAAARKRAHSMWKQAAGVEAMSGIPDMAQQPLRMFGPSALPFGAPHVVSELLAKQDTEPQSPLGERLRTTIDAGQQGLVEDLLARFADRGRQYGLNNAAALLIHWPTMEVRALAGSANFFDARIQGQVDGTKARRSPGSTLKPFIYGLALDQGLIHPMTMLMDSPRSFRGYDPENFDRTFRGPLPAREALLASRNIPAIELASKLHNPDLYQFLQSAGVEMPREAEHYGLSLVLGGAEVSLRELGQLYAMLARQGRMQPLRLVLDATEPDATSPAPSPVRVLSPEAAFITLSMLEDPSEGLSTPRGRLLLRMKTGTSNGFRDAWAAGLVGPYSLVVWVGNFDNSANPLLVGGQVAAPLFTDIAQALASRENMVDTLGDRDDSANRDDMWGEALNVQNVEVCKATGDTDVSLCPEKVQTLFIPGVSPVRSSGVFRTILVDTHTGLRACVPVEGRTEEQVWEFWPSDIQRVFLRAGIVKQLPPPFGPECVNGQGERVSPGGGRVAEPVGGNAPYIQVPKEGLAYQVRLSDPSRNTIPLTASVDADAERIFWFADARFLGESTPDSPLIWQPRAGRIKIQAVDNRGRAASRWLRVQAVP